MGTKGIGRTSALVLSYSNEHPLDGQLHPDETRAQHRLNQNMRQGIFAWCSSLIAILTTTCHACALDLSAYSPCLGTEWHPLASTPTSMSGRWSHTSVYNSIRPVPSEMSLTTAVNSASPEDTAMLDWSLPHLGHTRFPSFVAVRNDLGGYPGDLCCTRSPASLRPRSQAFGLGVSGSKSFPLDTLATTSILIGGGCVTPRMPQLSFRCRMRRF